MAQQEVVTERASPTHQGEAGAARFCTSCGESRPADHTYCFACGRSLGTSTVPANTKGFKRRGLGMAYSRIVTRQDRLGERPARTWGDTLARWYFTLTILAGVALWASGRGWLPVGLWRTVSAAVVSWMT